MSGRFALRSWSWRTRKRGDRLAVLEPARILVAFIEGWSATFGDVVGGIEVVDDVCHSASELIRESVWFWVGVKAKVCEKLRSVDFMTQ